MDSRLSIDKLLAARYYAYSFIDSAVAVESARVGGHRIKILDFGCGESPLPLYLIDHGQTDVFDRSKPAIALQSQRGAGVAGNSRGWSYDVIVSCFSVQHNSLESIKEIAAQIGNAVRPGGAWLYVGSYGQETRHQIDRQDPQWILNSKDWERHIVVPSSLTVESVSHYYYEHGTTRGWECFSGCANAIRAILRKKQF